MPDGAAWRDVVDQHHSRLIDELSMHLDSERLEAAAGERARATAQVECLNQVLRRLRAAGEEQVLRLLAEGCAQYAERLVVLVFDSSQTSAAARAGLSGEEIRFDTASAPAVVAAVESQDRMAALATPGELSPVLADAFGGASDRKAYLFPIVARHSVVAILVTSDADSSAQIELLCEAAGMRLEAASADSRAGRVEASAAPSWGSLTAEEQKLHMQAQRMARVRVAEMRLEHAPELNHAAEAGDIYTALRQPIGAARDQFRAAFLEKSHTMVDYLHMEILRSLAHDDERLLGPNYPGPMNVEPHV